MNPTVTVWNRDRGMVEMLGYLNFSEGKPDPRFQQNVNEFYRHCTAGTPWRQLHDELRQAARAAAAGSDAFRDLTQADRVLTLVFDRLLAAYRAFHADLLFHLPDRELFGPFWLARLIEVALSEGGVQDTADEATVLRRFNDFVGYRPVAILERKKCTPYEHEWVRPIPLYIRGTGVAIGRYESLIAHALEILARTSSAIRRDAYFDLDLLDELALDPRAYDFAHPANQRPNYQFGEWDPHYLDGQSRYRRFVLRGESLEALRSRVDESTVAPDGELLFESAAVLACTMLMASGTCGNGPDAHDSSVTLATLVPRIARYRDAFYAELLESIDGPNADRLRTESARLRQPFGGVRQYLNRWLAERRAAQLQHVHLGTLFAEMGYPDAGREQIQRIPTASARVQCELESRLTQADQYLDKAELDAAARECAEIERWIHRGIGCGALVDPWNILGFQGQFSLFPAIENSVPDPRIEELLELVERHCSLYARLMAESAAAGRRDQVDMLSDRFGQFATWWDQFAAVEVDGLGAVHGGKLLESATQVANALWAWRGAGEAAGDIKFWRQHVGQFESARSYARVVHVLLARSDFVAAMALLMSWLSQSETISLGEGEHSFDVLAGRWLTGVLGRARTTCDESIPATTATPTGPDWTLVQRFLNLLEANAEEAMQVPSLELGIQRPQASDQATDTEAEPDLFASAYEGVTYRDSTADGFEGEVLEGGPAERAFDLDSAESRITPPVRLIGSIARLIDSAAAHWTAPAEPASEPRGSHPETAGTSDDRGELLRTWSRQLATRHRALAQLLSTLHAHPIPAPIGSHDSLIEYDRRRMTKHRLMMTVASAQIDTRRTLRRLGALLPDTTRPEWLTRWESLAMDLARSLASSDTAAARSKLAALLRVLETEPLSYPRLDRGGDPSEYVSVWCIQHMLRELVEILPRHGLLREPYHVLETARAMERQAKTGSERVTEFDHLYRAALGAVVEQVLRSAEQWPAAEQTDASVLECLEHLAEPFVKLWVEHTRHVRLSSLDQIQSDSEWQQIRQFIERYGHDLFVPKFLALGNLRAILAQGTDRYLEQLVEDRDPLHPIRLIEELDRKIDRHEAARRLAIVLQVFIEHYAEYRDYNITTTQSDYGERFFILFEFLRLKAVYERTNWNLEPVRAVHESIVRAGRDAAAYQWTEALAEKTAEIAGTMLDRLSTLETQCGVRVQTVRDRLAERFVRPLQLDRLRLLVAPAIGPARGPTAQPLPSGAAEDAAGADSAPNQAFDRLHREIENLAETATGAGVDVPHWLRLLEAEVRRVRHHPTLLEAAEAQPVCAVLLRRADVDAQIDQWYDPL